MSTVPCYVGRTYRYGTKTIVGFPWRAPFEWKKLWYSRRYGPSAGSFTYIPPETGLHWTGTLM